MTVADRRIAETWRGATQFAAIAVIRAVGIGTAAVVVALSGRLVAWIAR